jgi:hypothetical protein
MIEIRRSKLEKVNMLFELEKQRQSVLKTKGYNLDYISEFLEKLLEIKKDLDYSGDFTHEEFKQIKMFIYLLKNEKYEELAKDGYRVNDDK